MSFNGLITTAGPPQWPEEARPEAAPEPGKTAHLAQKDAGSLLFRAGGDFGGPAAAGGAGTGRTATLGPGGQQGGSGPREEFRAAGKNAGGYSSAVCTGSACAGCAGADPQHRDSAPPSHRGDGSREGVRDAGS